MVPSRHGWSESVQELTTSEAEFIIKQNILKDTNTLFENDFQRSVQGSAVTQPRGFLE